MKPETQTKAELRAERDHWRKLAEKGLDPEIKHLRLENGALDMALAGPAVQSIAVLFAEYFREAGAENFLEFTINERVEPYSRFTLTMQRVNGLSPADKVRIAEERVAELEAIIGSASQGEEAFQAAVAKGMFKGLSKPSSDLGISAIEAERAMK